MLKTYKKIKEKTEKLLQIEISYECKGYKALPHEISVKMNFLDKDIQEYLLDHDYFDLVSVYSGIFFSVVVQNFLYPRLNEDTTCFFHLKPLIEGKKQEILFKNKEEAMLFMNVIEKRLLKFLYKYIISFLELKSIILAEQFKKRGIIVDER